VGVTHSEVLLEAHRLRVDAGDHHISDAHLADAIERLTERTRQSLSEERAAKNPYPRRGGGR
jgi:glyoxalase family protein